MTPEQLAEVRQLREGRLFEEASTGYCRHGWEALC